VIALHGMQQNQLQLKLKSIFKSGFRSASDILFAGFPFGKMKQGYLKNSGMKPELFK